MAATVTNAVQSKEVRFPDKVGRSPAKAHLKGPSASDFGHGQRIWEAIVRGHGSVKAAAFTMGQRDESQIRRQVMDGTIRLREFFEADENALCEFAEYVLATFQPARKSKRQIARERLPELVQLVLEATNEE